MPKIEQGSLPVHPGAMLRNKLKQFDCTRADAARHLGVSRQTLYQIIAEKQSVTPPVALRIARLTGTSPESWLDAQQVYDLALARRENHSKLLKVPVLDERW